MIQENKAVSVLDTPIKDCDFTVKLRYLLIKNGVHDVKQLLALSEKQIISLKYIRTSLHEIRKFLEKNNLKLSGHIDRKPKAEVETVFDMPIEHCGFKAGKILISLGILTVGELVSHSEDNLLGIYGLGATYVDDIKYGLHVNGLSLQEETTNGMQLSLSLTDSNSKQVIELWIELNEPLLAKDDNQLMKAKCFLENINRR